MSDIYVAKNYSFELNPEMLKLLAEEFNVDTLTSKFSEAVKGKGPQEIETAGKAFFEDYGRKWMKKTHQLGEQYPDRTYEVLMETIDKTGGYYRFALLPERFIEIAYLSTQPISTLPIIENNSKRLVYRLADCAIYQGIKEKCGEETARLMTCRHACLAACKTIHQDLEIQAVIEMEASIPKDGYCQFVAKRA